MVVKKKSVKKIKKETKFKKDSSDFRERNILAPEDFKKIESLEKKPVLPRFFSKKKTKQEPVKPVISKEKKTYEVLDLPAISKMLQKHEEFIDKLMLKEEMEEEKIAMEKEKEESLNERISELREKIGELRSTIIDRERFFDKMEIEFDKIKDAIHDIKPERIQKEFEKKEKVIIENQVNLEKIKDLVDNLNNEMKGYRQSMSKIKSFSNLVKTLNEINDKVELIEKTKDYTEQMASKVEILFLELNKRLTALVKHDEHIRFLEELTKDLVKSVDKNTIKIDESVLKEELEKKLSRINKEISILKDNMFKKELKYFKGKKEPITTAETEIITEETEFGNVHDLIEKERVFIKNKELVKAREIHSQLIEIYKNMKSERLKKRFLEDWNRIKDDMKVMGIKS